MYEQYLAVNQDLYTHQNLLAELCDLMSFCEPPWVRKKSAPMAGFSICVKWALEKVVPGALWWGQAVIPGMNNVNNVFPLLLLCQKEELAFVFEMLQQFEDALVQYDELDALFSQYVVNFGAGGKCLKMWNKCGVYGFLHCAEQPWALGSPRQFVLLFYAVCKHKCPSVTVLLKLCFLSLRLRSNF